MSRITPFHLQRGRPKKLDLGEGPEGCQAEFASDVSCYFHQEVSYIAKGLGVPYRSICICDHPCGEFVIFVRQGGKEVYCGYVDEGFYRAMEAGEPFACEDLAS